MNTRWLLAGLLILSVSPISRAEPPTTRPRRAAVISIEDEINDFTFTMLRKRMESARQLGVDTVILKINTWGGAAISAMEISQYLKRQRDVHTIALVDRKAISAGAMIALACDEIVMEPGSILGDCAPIVPGMQLERTERAKYEGPILAEFADSAQRNGYDPLLVQSMVTVGRVVYYIQSPSGERKFVDADGYDQFVKNGDWKPVQGVRNPIDDADSLLTVHADEALKLGLSKATVGSADDLAVARNLNIVATLNHSAGEGLVSLLSSAGARWLLIVVFVLSLYAAFHAPGHGAAEMTCLVSLSLLVGVPMLTGYASWVEILLIMLGIVLLAAEIFVIPGFGIVGIAGIVMVCFGLILTFAPSEPTSPGWLPALDETWSALWSGVTVLTTALAAAVLLGIWLNKYLPQVPYFRRLVLNTVVGSTPEVNYATLVDDAVWPEIGAVGRALTDLRPGGTAAFADPVSQDVQTTNVVSDSGFVAANTQIVVHEVHGNRIIVRPTETT